MADRGDKARCMSCGADVVWFKTASGKNMPVNADSVRDEDQTLELPRHISHFATCPQANQHRRRKMIN